MPIYNSLAFRHQSLTVTPAPRLPWTERQYVIVYHGLLEKKSFPEIAKTLAENEHGRPNAKHNNVYDVIHSNFGGIEKFLRSQGLIDEAKLADVLSAYVQKPRGEPRSTRSYVETWVPKTKQVAPAPRRLASDPLAERAALETIIVDGLRKGLSLGEIVDAAAADQIPTDVKAIQKIFKARGGIEEFLVYSGVSADEARAIIQAQK